MSKIKKTEQLGMNPSTARARLIKNVLFSLVRDLGRDTCYRCGRKIEKVDDFSIEHKNPWLDSKDPKTSYFDLDNIGFSHLKCNIGNTRPPKKTYGRSKYRGVFFHKDRKNKPWGAKTTVKGKSYNFGRFKTEYEAARAYDEGIKGLEMEVKYYNFAGNA